jgi:N-acetylneuraminic acid mutarotase
MKRIWLRPLVVVLFVFIMLMLTAIHLYAGSNESDLEQFTPSISSRQVSINWQTGPQTPKQVYLSATGIINDKIYMFGGYPVASWVHWAYDIATQTWDTTLTHDPYEDALALGAVYNDELYVLGGFGSHSEDYLRKYDPASDSWTMLSSPPACTTLSGYGVGVVGDKIYYYYGCFIWATHDYTNLCLQYNPLTDTWAQKNDAPLPARGNLGSGANGDYCYAVGGCTPAYSNECWRYYVPGDTWEQIEDFPDTIGDNQCCFIRNHLFCPGGGWGGIPPARREVYYWREGEGWNITDSLPLAVGSPNVAATTYNNTDYIFVIGGMRTGSWLRTLYIGTITGLGVEEDESKKPTFLDFAVVPNIIRNQSTIQFYLKKSRHVSAALYDVQGRIVTEPIDGNHAAGKHRVDFHTHGLPIGVYFLKFQAGDYTETKKLLLIK